MSYAPIPTTVFPGAASAAGLRQPSVGGAQSSQQSSALAARIAAKKAELENLKQLRDLSGALAEQMSQLEEKLSTLRDGTEAVACVLANWDHVLKAISLASVKATKVVEANGEPTEEPPHESDLPATLIRIPVQDRDTVAKAIQSQNPEEEPQTGG